MKSPLSQLEWLPMIFHRVRLKNALVPIRGLLCEDWDWFKRNYPDHLRDPLSQNMCLLTTAYLMHLFTQAGVTGWTPREGVPFVDEFAEDDYRPSGGMLGRNQRWSAHAWLEHEQGWILDLTADQFGYAEIIITRHTDLRYKHNIPQAEVMKRIGECAISLEWYAYHLEVPPTRSVIEQFTQLMSTPPQLDIQLPLARLNSEEAAL
ncbi:hypothetical protein [Pseudomonas taiwanensis]|uniref:hypothetical protein n=1 Tax=Pseudomonas taiwanensis TaxID=470150 RepID=UPI0028F154DB|nr:hypothetical protein [Pseudomonas taiwanensis]